MLNGGRLTGLTGDRVIPEVFIHLPLSAFLYVKSLRSFNFLWDDASSDNSWEIINSYRDSRIRAFRNEFRRRGVYGINKAISEIARGSYVAIHHSDDVWDSNKLRKQVDFLRENNKFGAVFSNALAINEAGALLLSDNDLTLSSDGKFYSTIFQQKNRSRHQWLRFFFKYGNALCHPSALIRRSCFRRCGLYRYGLSQIADLDMWMRLCLETEIYVLPDPLVRFRVLEKSKNTSSIRSDTRVRGHFELGIISENLYKITRHRDIVKIFPEARKYLKRGVEGQIALARAMLDLKPFYSVSPFALRAIFNVVSQETAGMEVVREEYFKLINYHDPLNVNELDRLRASITEKNQQLKALHKIVAELQVQREKEHAAAVKEIAALRQWATGSDAFAKQKQAELAELHKIVAELQVQLEGSTSDLEKKDIAISALSRKVQSLD
jgi:glycosyltransferase involved in cell wall biosynthesis